MEIALKAVAVVLGIIALFLSFRAETVLKNIFKIPEPTQKQILNCKFVAFGVAVVAFIIVFIK